MLHGVSTSYPELAAYRPSLGAISIDKLAERRLVAPRHRCHPDMEISDLSCQRLWAHHVLPPDGGSGSSCLLKSLSLLVALRDAIHLGSMISVIDAFAFATINLIPTKQTDVTTDKNSLHSSVGNTITIYQQLCIPSPLYPGVPLVCVTVAL
ncbi:hypothetical protein B0H13DRAFT_2351935 [Mycena leptocephala]|nr:hypothetical protein B0H13DRAFT_2351935 [Mycena leptocephala]